MIAGKPKVSIGMPVYNEERFIKKALDSLLSQTFENFELIISDNASTDRTGDICREYAAKDQRIRYYRAETNLGSSANFNRTFELSNAEYFFITSGHDLRHERFISSCLKVLENDKSVTVCYPMARWIDSDGKLGDIIFDHVDTRGLDVLSGFHVVLWGAYYTSALYGIIRSSALRKTGFMRNIIGPDIVFVAELSLLGTIAQVPEPLLYIRKLPDFGDWEQYLLKHLYPGSATRSCLYLYCKWIHEFTRIATRHGKSFREKFIYMLSIFLCMLTKYRWVLRGLWNMREIKKSEIG